MKRIIILIITLTLLLSMAIPTYAVTPSFKFKAVKIPEIKVTNVVPQSYFENYFRENPIIINWNK